METSVTSSVFRYLATEHRLWHTIIERLEQQLDTVAAGRLVSSAVDGYSDDTRLADTLIALYEQLGERDAVSECTIGRVLIGASAGCCSVAKTHVHRRGRQSKWHRAHNAALQSGESESMLGCFDAITCRVYVTRLVYKQELQ